MEGEHPPWRDDEEYREAARQDIPVVTAVLAAAGYGRRLGAAKAFYPLAGRPMIWYSLSVFENSLDVDQVVLVVSKEDQVRALEYVEAEGFAKVRDVAVGGRERGESVWNGLRRVDPRSRIVMVHDGARPLVTHDLVRRALLRCVSTGSGVPAIPVQDSVRRIVHEFATQVVDRKELYLIQTPQVFRYDTLYAAYRRGAESENWPSDDAALVENLGEEINLVEGSAENIKITTREDLLVAEAILSLRASRGGSSDLPDLRSAGGGT